MGFVERELAKLSRALVSDPDGVRYAELYAAQQALSWSLDPQGFKPPFAMITGIQEGSGDCSADSHHSPLPDIGVRSSGVS